MARQGISAVDLNLVYAGAFVSFFAFLERSIEELFMGIITKRIDYGRREISPLVDFRSSEIARQLVFGGRSYVDWLPIRITKERAQLFLSNGSPFSDLSQPDSDVLHRMGVIRNALSHESSFARKTFRELLVDGKALPPDQTTPAGYLRGQYAVGQTRLELVLSQVVGVMTRLCT
jgi:hypothetical protein